MQFRRCFAENLDHTIESLSIQFAADRAIQRYRSSVDGNETEKLLQPGQCLLGMLDQAQVQPEAPITPGFSIGRGIEVVDQDNRIVSDQVGNTLEELDGLIG